MTGPRSKLTPDEARAVLLDGVGRLGEARVALGEAQGRVLAEDVVADRSQPPFAASAMDGWAVGGPGPEFHIVGVSAAGHGHGARLGADEAVRIFTGAPVPEGARQVVVQELAEAEGERLRIPDPPPARDNIRGAGVDFRVGDLLLRAGAVLDPWRLALAAAAGRADLLVARRPEVVVIGTGSEVVDAGTAPGPDQIFDSNTPALAALVRAWGGAPGPVTRVRDEADAVVKAIGPAGGDLVVTLGGASVGEHDLVKPALRALGLVLDFEQVRLRPGKPVWAGRLADGRRVLGLPGNPGSALVCAELFLAPLLRALQGSEPGPFMETARLAAPLPVGGPFDAWLRARLWTEAGMLMAAPLPDQDSSLVQAFAGAQALIRRRPDAEAAEAGAVVEVLRLGRG